MNDGLGEWDDEPTGTAAEEQDAQQPEEPGEQAPELVHKTVAEFVTEKLAVTYRRQINPGGGVTGARNGGNTRRPSAGSKRSGGHGNSCAWKEPPA